jgi:hypothetical protein
MKKYAISIDMDYPMEYIVKAKTKREAQNIAWKKFIKRVPKKAFSIDENPDSDNTPNP